MKVSFSSSSIVPALRLPSIQVNFWRFSIVLVGLFFGLSLWVVSTQVSLPIWAGMAVRGTEVNIAAVSESISPNEPAVSQASYEQAIALRQGGDLVGALHQLEQVAMTSPPSVPVLYELGRVEFQLGKVQPAIAHYRKALTVDPNYAPAAYELGSILVTLGRQVDEGIQYLQQAVALAPTDLYFYDLGIAQGRVGNVQAKIDALEQALVLKPNYADALLNLGLTYARLGDITQAKHYLQEARDLYQAEIEKLEHAHLGRNSLDAQIIDQMLLKLDTGCGVECWASTK